MSMKNYMAVYTGTPDKLESWMRLDAKERASREKKGMEAWENWATKNAGVIVDQGAPLGKTKRVAPNGVSDVRNNLAAYTVVKAESQEAAAKLFVDHPHFTLFPGDGVDIMECLPMPAKKQ
jgi:hypothetical protein